MYPSNGIHDTSLFLFSDNMCTNPSSTIEDFSSSSLLNVFPSSHLIDFNDNTVFFQDFHDILHQKVNGQEMDQEMVTYEGASNINMSKIDVKTKKLSCGGSSKLREQIRVKRKCHKDRHSKITTANGSSRGRRMRLPLNVAKEFFALQDMLEFDKASKTVEWLLKKSKNAIKEETTKRANMSHSPCPSTSAIDELEPEAPTSKEKTRVTQRVSATHPVTRGLREKARARARERTQKKKQLQLLGGVTDNDRCRLYNCSQGMNIGSDHPSLNCEKSAAAGDKFLDMGARARERTQKRKQLQLVGGVTDNDRSRQYNCSQGMNIGSDHPSLNCEKSAAAGDKFLDMGARARERTQKRKQLQLVGGVTDNDRSRLYNCSQGMNIGSDHPPLNCEKSAAAGNKFLDMRNGSPAPVLELEGILNYSKQQPHSFEDKTNTEEFTIDHSFFVSNNWDPYTFFNLHHNSTTTL